MERLREPELLGPAGGARGERTERHGRLQTGGEGDLEGTCELKSQSAGVIVASNITKSASTISGNAPEVVVVKTDPGYGPSGKGTGVVIAIACTG